METDKSKICYVAILMLLRTEIYCDSYNNTQDIKMMV